MMELDLSCTFEVLFYFCAIKKQTIDSLQSVIFYKGFNSLSDFKVLVFNNNKKVYEN